MPPVSETPPPAAQPVIDPLYPDSAVPPADPASQSPPAPTAIPPATANQPLSPASAGQTLAAPAASAAPNTFWKYLHVVAGVGYNTGGKIAPDAEPFNSAAPSYSGLSLSLQPSFQLFQDGPLSLRAGANLEMSFLSVPSSPGFKASSVRPLLLAALGEVNYDFRPVGIGANLSLGWLGLSSSDADVGAAPANASFDWVSEGGPALGVQLYAHALNQKVRAGISFTMLGDFSLATAPGQPDLRVSYPTALMFFVGGDLGDLVRKVVGVDSGPMPSATQSQ